MMTKKLLLLSALLFIALCPAWSQLSNALSYQGLLMQDDGVTPISDGAHEVEFRFYTVAQGGTPMFSRSISVVSSRGLFSCVIGDGSAAGNEPLPADFGHNQFYIGIAVDGGAELTPRTVLTPSPAAFTIVPQAYGPGAVPPGGIIMWSGSVDEIPTGYALCNGQSYTGSDGAVRPTPDLRGRFIVGYDPGDTDYNALEKTGGEKKHTLSVDELPSHSHTTSSSGSHSHSGTTDTRGSHRHDFWANFGSGIGGTHALAQVGNTSWGNRGSDYIASSGDHSHPFTTNSTGSHTHTISNTGGGQAHENRPPYFVLAFIIRKH